MSWSLLLALPLSALALDVSIFTEDYYFVYKNRKKKKSKKKK
jgi:hypothetical protein